MGANESNEFSRKSMLNITLYRLSCTRTVRIRVFRKSPKMLSLDTVEEISDACGAGSNVIFDIIILR